MKKIFIYTIVMLFLTHLDVWGQQTIMAPTNRILSSFAIIVDRGSYDACKESIQAYKQVIEKDGLAVYILIADWESPEHVKFFLQKYYNEQSLEGAVFIGDIPIPMIRKAQHLTSAFKMDEKRYEMRQSSVPSDRFYDDFNLKFDFVAKDSLDSKFYYYNLRGNSSQKIDCSIYTGRIKPTKTGTEGYKQINDYLSKLVAERSVENPLDKLCSYTGHGSFSNSLAAWKDEAITLREQIPAAFYNSEDAKFYMFYMYPSMKETVIKELKRDNLDIMLFHEHGMPSRQYLTGLPTPSSDEESFEAAKYGLRENLRRAKSLGKNVTETKRELIKKYKVDSTWFAGAFDKDVIAKDSLEDLKQGIVVEEVPQIAPSPRLVIFDACYNGDFREQSFIAGEYIFAKGKTLVCFGNSVNVLQDKSSSDLMGLLACGFRIGEWAKCVNILESHIIGDPTFRFAKPTKLPNIRVNSNDTTYWFAILDHNLPPDLKGLALHKLFNLNCTGLSKILYDVYRSSNSYMLRLQCLHLLAYYNDSYYAEVLKLAIKDPYEFIRRKAAYYMGKVGRNDFIPYLVTLYMEDYTSERVTFNILASAGHLNSTILKNEFKKRIDDSNYIYDKEGFYSNIESKINSQESIRDIYWADIINPKLSLKKRMSAVSILRNNPYTQAIDDLLIVLENNCEPLELRVAIAEALGWFERSIGKQKIIDRCNSIFAHDVNINAELKDELNKTVNRLSIFMR
ncbi:MAG: HEAT repeat domain-containing protein [Bacteroidales bacterium]